MLRFNSRVALAAAIVAVATGAAAGPSSRTDDGRIRVVGYNDMDEMLPALAVGLAREHPELRFAFDLKSTRGAPPALIDGTSAFAPMGAEMTDVDLATYARIRGGAPVFFAIAHDSVKAGVLSSPTGVFVHASNPLRRITMRDVRRIFAPANERISSWRALGLRGAWQSRTVTPVGFGSTTAIGLRLTRTAFEGRGFVADYHGLPQSREVAAAIATDPYAIGLANLGSGRPEIRALKLIDDHGEVHDGSASDIMSGRYPLDRHLLIYARRGADGCIEPIARIFLAFALSDRGQRVIASGTRGYLPLNRRERGTWRQLLDRCSVA